MHETKAASSNTGAFESQSVPRQFRSGDALWLQPNSKGRHVVLSGVWQTPIFKRRIACIDEVCAHAARYTHAASFFALTLKPKLHPESPKTRVAIKSRAPNPENRAPEAASPCVAYGLPFWKS